MSLVWIELLSDVYPRQVCSSAVCDEIAAALNKEDCDAT
jgi:hypothetical protein